jgi:hypothetical protein
VIAHQEKSKTADGKTSSPPKHSSDRADNLTMRSHDSIPHLQLISDYQAVQSLKCPQLGFDFASMRIFQPKLKLSQPGDPSEQEADRVAQQVMRVSTNDTVTSTAMPVNEKRIDRKCAACEMKKDEKEEEEEKTLKISRLPSTMSNFDVRNEVIEEISNIQSNAGSSLDSSTKEFMESRFGYDFSNVRIHTDEMASRSARSLNAFAYTVGNNIVFGEGQYLPNDFDGRKLLAHELMHIIQQSSEFIPTTELPITTLEKAVLQDEDQSATSPPKTRRRALPTRPPALRQIARQARSNSPSPVTPVPTLTQSPQTTGEGTSGYLSLTPEQALSRCEANDLPGIKVFPFRGTRFGGAPISAYRVGDDIIVKQPIHVFTNDDFRAQTRTLPITTFTSGVRLRSNEPVRIHIYEPRWYHLNITGSTEGDIEREICLTGEQMLQVADASTTATLLNIVVTGIEAATLFVPVGEIASRLGQPILQAGRTGLAATMLGTAEVIAPRTLGTAAERAAITIVEGQVQTRAAGQAVTRTVSQTVLQTAERGLLEGAVPRAAAEAVPRLGASKVAGVIGKGLAEAGVEATASRIGSAVTSSGTTPRLAPPRSEPAVPSIAAPPTPGPITSGVKLTTVTGDQIIVDTNVARALDKAARGLTLQEGEEMMVAAAQRHGIVLTDEVVAELSRGGGVQGTAMVTQQVKTTIGQRQAIMTALEHANVGRTPGDRVIVQQALLSQTAPGVIPILATADKGVINGLARLAGIDPARLGRYPTVAEFLLYERGSTTFEVLIEGRRLVVIPIQAVRSGL